MEADGNDVGKAEPDAIGRLALQAHGMGVQDAANFFKWAT
jgi:hypothetical protein